MANMNRLIELGMPPELAKEVAAQIDDGGTPPAPPTAAEVSFDPADAPGVSATNVQEAIEELATIVDGA